MATIDAPLPGTRAQGEASQELAKSWRKLTRAATRRGRPDRAGVVRLVHAPERLGLVGGPARHAGDHHRLPRLRRPPLPRADPVAEPVRLESRDLREEDIVGRRRPGSGGSGSRSRSSSSRSITIVWIFRGGTWWGTVGFIFDGIGTDPRARPRSGSRPSSSSSSSSRTSRSCSARCSSMNMSQMQSFEPGDAEWGVKLDDVRGQVEAKEEVRRVVDIWQSGEQFERARRQARAGPAPLRRAGHRQDDAREGDRDGVQLAVHLDAGLGLRRDLHRHRRHHRPAPRRQGEAARAQVGRPVHRLHRRDRRRRHAAAVARHGRTEVTRPLDATARAWRTSSSTARGARATPPAT